MMSRGWWLRAGAQTPATHLLLDGGRLSVPDDHAGTFLNLYLNALLRKEKLSVVELKTPIFRLFFDIDARIKGSSIQGSSLDTNEEALAHSTEPFASVFRKIYEAVQEFWVTEQGTRMIVCAAPPKPQETDLKLGFHVLFPTIYTNAPIALAFRDALLQKLDEECKDVCVNAWSDAIDPCVFKANGLRAIYSCKGPSEDRAYIPYASFDGVEYVAISKDLSVQDRRAFVHECSIRVFQTSLTPCVGGQDTVADQPHVHSAGGLVIGRSVPLDAYADVLPKVHAALPAHYATQRFVGVFKTDHAVMLRSSSRYCQNVGREHRTSTVYFCVTKRGVCQKCYCRKDDHGCTGYSSEQYPLESAVIEAFVPLAFANAFVEDEDVVVRKMPSKRKSTSSIDTLLHRSMFLQRKKGSKRKK